VAWNRVKNPAPETAQPSDERGTIATAKDIEWRRAGERRHHTRTT